MNPMIQSGTHPDTDTLTAFAEQLLPPDERKEILAHMAVCGRCREVIFLAHRDADQQITTAMQPSVPVERMHTWRLGGWRWAWIPAGAVAALIGVSTMVHLRRAPTESEMARSIAPSETLPSAIPQPAINNPSPKAKETKAFENPKPQPRRPRLGEELDQKGVQGRRELGQGETSGSLAMSPGAAGGSVHGAMKARAEATPYGGPMANQLQQNSLQQASAAQQNSLASGIQENIPASTTAPNEAPAAKPMIAAPARADTAQTATVSAGTGAKATTPMPLSFARLNGTNAGISPAATELRKKATNITLPDGAQALSVAIAAKLTIAIDPSGALFRSEDEGKHWQPIATQWTGRAVLVRNLPGAQVTDVGEAAAPGSKFELVNDQLRTWTSSDGKTWTAATLPVQ